MSSKEPDRAILEAVLSKWKYKCALQQKVHELQGDLWSLLDKVASSKSKLLVGAFVTASSLMSVMAEKRAKLVLTVVTVTGTWLAFSNVSGSSEAHKRIASGYERVVRRIERALEQGNVSQDVLIEIAREKGELGSESYTESNNVPSLNIIWKRARLDEKVKALHDAWQVLQRKAKSEHSAYFSLLREIEQRPAHGQDLPLHSLVYDDAFSLFWGQAGLAVVTASFAGVLVSVKWAQKRMRFGLTAAATLACSMGCSAMWSARREFVHLAGEAEIAKYEAEAIALWPSEASAAPLKKKIGELQRKHEELRTRWLWLICINQQSRLTHS